MALAKLPAVIRLTMPSPPTMNTIWRRGKGKTYLSDKARNYRGAGRLAYAQATGTLKVAFPDGDVAVTLRWFRPAKRGDLDNIGKAALDSLRGVAYTDDKQITELHFFRYDAKDNPRLEVTLSRPIP